MEDFKLATDEPLYVGERLRVQINDFLKSRDFLDYLCTIQPLSELMEAFSDDSDSSSEDNEPPFLNNHLPVFPHIPTARSLR